MGHPCRVIRTSRRALLAAAGAVALSGCGGAPPLSPRTGIDGLTIPWGSPQGDRFAAYVDHPLLALDPDRPAEYDVAGVLAVRATRTAEPAETVAGLPVTPVRQDVWDERDRRLATWRDLLAQDRDGNVWWVGHEGGSGDTEPSWTFGEEGLGLLLAASPRLGDGYRAALVGDVVDLRGTVVGDRSSVDVPAGDFDDAVRLELRTGTGALATLSSYAPGAGLVELSGGAWGTWRLRAPD